MSFPKYYFRALRRNYQWLRERVAAEYRCHTDEELAASLADAYSREWYVEKVYGPDGRPIPAGVKGEFVRQAQVAGLRVQEERARLRRSVC